MASGRPFTQPVGKYELNISDALVTLYEDGEAVGKYKNSSQGVYELDLKGQIGKKYSLAVLLPDIPQYPEFSGKEIISESELLAPVSEIKDIYGVFRNESLIYDEGFYVSIDTYDPKGKGNYYRWTLNVNGEVSKDPKQIMLLEDDRVDGNQILDLDLTFEPFNAGDSVAIRQQSISKDFHQYLMDIYMQALTQESFFDSPSYNPLSNLKSDIPVVGYFNASAYTEAALILEED